MKWETRTLVATGHTSHPARGARIEMVYEDLKLKYEKVAPRKGCAD